MTGMFVNPLSRNDSSIVARARAIKQWTREILSLADEVIVSVSELACTLPDCPPRETVVLVMRPGETTFQVSIHKSMRDLTRDDIASIFAGAADTGRNNTDG